MPTEFSNGFNELIAYQVKHMEDILPKKKKKTFDTKGVTTMKGTDMCAFGYHLFC